jgi:hydroxymethylpyrimidine/phosphomethylpyrimidine kinase
MTAIALTIAGSDSGGGAGIQADLKTFSALGTYGCSVITALTAQNTKAVAGVLEVPPDFIRAQLDAVFIDLDIAAVKIGMLGSAAIIEAVAAGLESWKPRWVVLDPVMVAKSGDKLLQDDAVQALRARLIPLVDLITPNLPEAAVLLNEAPVQEADAMPHQAEQLLGLGAKAVLLKGGHLDGPRSPDLLHTGDRSTWLDAPRVATRHTHGTGCTLSSAITAYLAQGWPLPAAVQGAKNYLSEAISAATQLSVGKGRGPVHHFHHIWPQLQFHRKEIER